jgi:HAD superfamily hydrolase (TIGR01490 family)
MSIAIFDLDGTITRHDTLFPLVLRWLARRPWQLLRLVRVVPAVVRFCFDHDRAALKQSLLRATLRGVPRAALLEFARGFVRDQIATGSFHDALATVRRHRDAGHYLVLMSASVDFYVPEFARQLEFDQAIATEVRWNGDRLDGTLTSANRRGEEKARCLPELARGASRPGHLRLRQQRVGPAAPQAGPPRHAGQRQPGGAPCRRRTRRGLRRLDVRRGAA